MAEIHELSWLARKALEFVRLWRSVHQADHPTYIGADPGLGAARRAEASSAARSLQEAIGRAWSAIEAAHEESSAIMRTRMTPPPWNDAAEDREREIWASLEPRHEDAAEPYESVAEIRLSFGLLVDKMGQRLNLLGDLVGWSGHPNPRANAHTETHLVDVIEKHAKWLMPRHPEPLGESRVPDPSPIEGPPTRLTIGGPAPNEEIGPPKSVAEAVQRLRDRKPRPAKKQAKLLEFFARGSSSVQLAKIIPVVWPEKQPTPATIRNLCTQVSESEEMLLMRLKLEPLDDSIVLSPTDL